MAEDTTLLENAEEEEHEIVVGEDETVTPDSIETQHPNAEPENFKAGFEASAEADPENLAIFGKGFETTESTDTSVLKASQEDRNVSQVDSDETAIEDFNETLKHELQKKEMAKLEAEDPTSIWWTVKDSGKWMGLGVFQMGENVLSTVNIIEEGAWNIPEPETTRQALFQGFPQALSFFIPATWGIKGGLGLIRGGNWLAGKAMTTLFNTSAKLKKARDMLAFGVAGAATDALAFKKDDPNAANMAFLFDSISKSPVASHWFYTYLATKPEGYKDPATGELDPDSPAIARTKNVISGAGAGIITAALMRAVLGSMGFVYNKISTTTAKPGITEAEVAKSLDHEVEQMGKVFEAETGVSIKTLEKATKEYVDEILPLLKATYDQADEAGKKAILDNLPQHLEPAIKEEIKRNLSSPIAKIGIGKTLKEPNPGLVKLLTKYLNGEKIDAPDYFFMGKNKHGKVVQKPIIESLNLLKLQTVPEIKSLLQALSRIIDNKSLKNKTYLSQVQSVADLIGRPVDEVIETLGQNVANLEKAVGYVDAYKALILMALDNTHTAFKKFQVVKVGTDEYDQLLAKRNAAAAQLEMILSLSSRESSLASHLLHAHTAKVGAGEMLTKSQLAISNEIFNASARAEIKYSHWVDNFIEMSKKRTDEFRKDVEVDVKIPGVPKRRVKVTKGATKKGKRLNTKLTATQARIKRLEKKLANLRKGKLPKKTEPRLKTAEELRLEDLIELEIEKLTIPKAQRALQVRHRELTKKIKDLRAGKVTKKGFNELKTTEILELEAELKQTKQKLKPLKTNSEKTEANIKRLRAELDKLILTKKGTAKVSTKKTTTDLEKELIEEIKNQKERLGWLKDKHRVTLEDLRELALQTATKEEAKIIENSVIRQLRMRMLAPKLTRWAKYRHISEEIFINGLLSSFKTPVVNGIGNNFALGMYPIETFMAATKGGGAITHREAAIFTYSAINAIPSQLKVFYRAMRYGTDDVQIKTDIQKPQTRFLSKELLEASGWRGEAIDFIGKLVNLPGKLVTSMDVAYKGLNYAGAIPALTYRKAVAEFMEKHGGRKPQTPDELIEVDLRSSAIKDDIDLYPDIVQEAKAISEKNTFTDDLPTVKEQYITAEGVKEREVAGIAKLIGQSLDRDPYGIMRAYLPFYRTPYQLLRFAAERSPILRSRHKTLQRELDPKQSSPEVVQMARGRVAASQLLFSGAVGLALKGLITNGPPADPKLRAQQEASMGGPHWWTFNIGFGPIPYTRWDPIGLIFSQAAIVANFTNSMISLNGQAELDEEGQPLVEDRKLVEKHEEMWAQAVSGLQSLIKDRHYLQSLMQSVAIFDEDTHIKQKWINQLRTRFDPTLSIFSSIRRNIIKGHHAGKPLKELPERPESEWDADKQRYTGVIGGTVFERSNRNMINEQLNVFDEYQKTLYGFEEGAGVQGPTITGLTVGEVYKIKNLMGETEFYPGTHYEKEKLKPYEYVRNMMNSIFNIAATNIGTSESQSAVIRKLADLGSKIEAPSQIKSFPVGKHSVSGKSLGSVRLNTREQRYFIEEWIRLNTKNNYLEKTVRGWRYNSPPTNLNSKERSLWWLKHQARGGYTEPEQLANIEQELRQNKEEAIWNTKDRFEDLQARLEHLYDLGQSSFGDAPELPKLPGAYQQQKSQMAPLVPLTEENKGQ